MRRFSFSQALAGLAMGLGLAAPLVAPLAACGQQDPNWTLYMFNRTVLNPAFAGHHGSANFTFAGRSQWVGLEGHPNSFSFAFSKPAPRLRGSFGAYMLGDQVGPFAGVELKGVYAYRFELGGATDDYVQVGLNAGFIYRSLDGTNWRPPQSQFDPVLNNAVVNQVVPDVGFGAVFVKNDVSGTEKYYVGLGINHLLEPALDQFTTSGNTRINRHIYLTGGYRYDLSRRISLQPSVLIRLAGAQWQADLNVNMTVSPMVFGLSYRYEDAVSGLVGFQATSRLFIAYAYDYPSSRLAIATSGSHEIILSYTLPRPLRIDPGQSGVKYKRRRQ